jgi:transposase-like protein
MKKQRRHYMPEEKVAILRRHLVEGVPISDLCDELGLQPTVFYLVESKGSHAIYFSQPEAVAALIEQAASKDKGAAVA